MSILAMSILSGLAPVVTFIIIIAGLAWYSEPFD